MLLAFTAVVFVALLALSMPIVFALGIAGVLGLVVGGTLIAVYGLIVAAGFAPAPADEGH